VSDKTAREELLAWLKPFLCISESNRTKVSCKTFALSAGHTPS